MWLHWTNWLKKPFFQNSYMIHWGKLSILTYSLADTYTYNHAYNHTLVLVLGLHISCRPPCLRLCLWCSTHLLTSAECVQLDLQPSHACIIVLTSRHQHPSHATTALFKVNRSWQFFPRRYFLACRVWQACALCALLLSGEKRVYFEFCLFVCLFLCVLCAGLCPPSVDYCPSHWTKHCLFCFSSVSTVIAESLQQF